MDNNLLMLDIEKFLNKYTRFMTKNIYITNIIYDRFVNNYRYLYDEVRKNIYLYKDSIKYKKMVSIINDKDKLIKLHNKKYLCDEVNKLDNNIDKNIRKILLCSLDKILVIDNKKYMDIIKSKISGYVRNKVLIITDIYDKYRELVDNIGDNYNIYDIESLGKNILDSKYMIISDYDKYKIISYYIKNILYKDKNSFKRFCDYYWDSLYFNKDYLDFDTFRDYHNYIFKRMFLSSKSTKDKFNKKMISKRRSYLRSINDELLFSKEEVDIANFLYLNSIKYSYDSKNRCFYISNGDISDIVRYLDSDKESNSNDILLYNKYMGDSKALEHLVYELIKRRYPMEKVSDDDIYNRLRDTCEDGYFSKCVSDVIVPLINNYSRISDVNKKNSVRDIYNYYRNYIDSNDMVDSDKMISMIRDRISDDYEYVILLEGSSKILSKYNVDNVFSKCMIINYDYSDSSIVSSNVKSIYDYKRYVNDNKSIPINNVYTGYGEIENIYNGFINSNNNINKEMDYSKIDVCFYDDSKRLLVGKNKAIIINKIVSLVKGNVLILSSSNRDRNIIFNEEYFDIRGKKEIVSKNNLDVKINYSLINDKIDKIYDYIILVDIISNKYYDIKDSIDSNVVICECINRCRNKLFIMCPYSKKDDIDKVFSANI